MELVLDDLLNLVKLYVSRQELAKTAMLELNPAICFFAEHSGSMTVELVNEYKDLLERYSQTSKAGRWGKDNEWECTFHGKGCRLNSRLTGEPIDWDAPDLTRLDFYFFLACLQWLLEQPDPEDASVNITSRIKNEVEQSGEGLEKFIASRFRELVENKILSGPSKHNKYHLIQT